MSCETLDSQIVKGLVKIIEPRVQEKKTRGRRDLRKEDLSKLTSRQIAFIIYAFFEITTSG